MKIDWWTIGFQAVNVLVLVLLLRHFFWAPIAAMIAGRQDEAKRAIDMVAKQQGDSVAAQADIAKIRDGFASERETILSGARIEADHMRAVLLGEATTEAAALVQAARDTIAADRQHMEELCAQRSTQLGVDIARRLAARLTGPAVSAAFLDWLLKAVSELPQAARQAVATHGGAMDAVSASALSAGEQASVAGLIDKALGRHTDLAFRVDPSMIAGLELHAPHLTVSNSWRADLAAMQAELSHAG